MVETLGGLEPFPPLTLTGRIAVRFFVRFQSEFQSEMKAILFSCIGDGMCQCGEIELHKCRDQPCHDLLHG